MHSNSAAHDSAPHTPSIRGLDYRTIWRWHFYAGLFCIPFILWLAITGTIYLFKPQVDTFLDRPYDHLSIDTRSTANAQVQAALAAVPGSSFDSYQLPRTPTSAAQVLVDQGTLQFRVYVHPATLNVLKVKDEDRRFENIVFRLHGELLIGNAGSWIVELAASWAVVMILTGLSLWWPRGRSGISGVLYPRFDQGKRIFWRDIHAVTGVYISLFTLFLLFTGLPWAKSWGSYLKAVRRLNVGHVVTQDWTTSSSDKLIARSARSQRDQSGMSNMHEMQDGMNANAMANMSGIPPRHTEQVHVHGRRHGSGLHGPDAFMALDKMIATVDPLKLQYPVLISPPIQAGGDWTAKSDTQNRPLRVNLILDGSTGALVKRNDFNSKPWIDRVIGTCIAAHEGQLFGIANQLLGLFTTSGLVTLSLSGLIMWWRRRPAGLLGAPSLTHTLRLPIGLIALLIVMAVYFPFLGGSMILVGLTERFVLRRIPVTQQWLGLRPARVPH